MLRNYVCKMKRWRVALLALVLFFSFTYGSVGNRSFATLAEPGSIRVSEADGLTSYIVNDAVRVQPLSETLVRLEEKGPKGFEDRATYYIVDRAGVGSAESAYTEDDDAFYIAAKSYIVRVSKTAAGLRDVLVTDKSGNTLYAYNGETTPNTYLPSPSDELSCWYFSDSPRVIPSESGYAAIDTDEPFNGWDFENNAADMYVFLPQGNYRQFCSDYTRLTGPSELVDLKMLGYWDSRWYAYSAESALQQVHDYLDKGYSIDMMVIDTDWRKSSSMGGVGYDINTDLFPDMAGFLEDCHELGVNVTFNDHPEPAKGSSNGLDKSEINYRTKNLKLILSMGLDFWWYDRNWGVSLNSATPDISVYAFGMYAFQFITEDYYRSIADIDEFARRALIMGNVDGCLNGDWVYASDLSAHRYSIQWTGDIGANEISLAMELRNSIFGGAENGIPYISSDIGGHNAPVTDNMYSRWMQYGALSTICRVHCTNSSYIGQEGRMPWLFGDTAEAVTKEYIGMRYRLLPLYYNLSAENYQTGLPIMRRLDIEYPQYAEASRNDEYLLGDGILIAPITEAEKQTGVPAAWFSCEIDGKKQTGLKGEYYANKSFSGAPAYTRTDTEFICDWGEGGPQGLGNDNYSIRWTGKFTVGNVDSQLQFYGDDGITVYVDGKLAVDGSTVYDTLLATEYYAARSTHTIEIRYFEDGGKAHFYMYSAEKPLSGASVCYNTRSVFIPDGVWLDVWTGKEFVGPKTYTVTHGLETSPIFVKQGSLTVLAEDMQNTSQKDWSNVALEVYPTLAGSASTRLYEDDTETVAYKSGAFRTTEIQMAYVAEKEALSVEIGAAEGSFAGDKAFDTRTWNVRVHTYKSLGEVTSVKVDSKPVSMRYFVRSSSASPFAFSGASADNDVYEFAFTGDVYTKHSIEITFSGKGAFTTQRTAVSEYDASAAAFTLVAEEAGNLVNLDDERFTDWAYYGGDGTAIARKSGADHLFTDVTSGFGTFTVADNLLMTSWTTGEGLQAAEELAGGIAGQVDLNLAFTVEPNGAPYYILYCSGERALAKLTVRDRAGSVRTITFGDLEGKFLYRAVIKAESEETAELYVNYMVYSAKTDKLNSPSRIGLSAVAAATELPEMADAVYADVAVSTHEQRTISAGTNVDLTDNGADLGAATLDWFKSGPVSDKNMIYKANAGSIIAVNYSTYQPFFDYAGVMRWTDGEEVVSSGGTTNGLCTSGSGNIEVTLRVDENTQFVRVYTGCWRATNTVTVYDANGNILVTSDAFSAGESSVCRALTFRIQTDGSSRIKIVIRSSAEYNNGNVSLSALTVLGKTASAN